MQDQAEDRGLAGLARPRPVSVRPTASADPAILGPVPDPLDCAFLHLEDDAPACLALPPAIRLSRRQVELVCAAASHVACPRYRRANSGRGTPQVEPPAPARGGRADRSTRAGADAAGLADAADRTDASATGRADEPAAPIPPVEPAPRSEPASPAERAAPGEPAALVQASAQATRPPAAELTKVRPSTTALPGLPAAPGTTREPARHRAAPRISGLWSRPAIALRPATAIAWLVLGAVLVLVIVLLSARGGLLLPPAATPSSGVVLTSPGPSSPMPSVPGTASPTLSASPSPAASPSLSPSPSGSPSSSPAASPPFPADRMLLLRPCPGIAGCYQYRVKSGDNLRKVAIFFGVTYPALLAANPEITNPSIIHVGDLITIPIPTA